MSRKILLADDSPTIQKVVELTFAETDFEVVAVSGGDELLERLPEVRPDVVICDVLMPGLDGYEVCERIKSDPATLHIPVVLLTGTFEPFDRERALAAGCDEIVTKPFEARQLIETVERVVSGEPPSGTAPFQVEVEGAVVPPEPAPEPAAPAEAAPEAAATPAPGAGVPAEAPGPGWGGPEAGGVPDEGLDFTTTGFAEMEAAGRRPHVPMEPPEEGLEMEPGGERPLDLPLPERQEEAAAPFQEQAVEEAPAPAEEGPFAAPSAPAPEQAPPAPEPAGPAEPAPPMEEPPAEAVEPPGPEPAAPAEEEPAAGPAPPPTPVAPGGALSEEDVDRIARRVLELAADRIERIAWEVIPDMAEIVVRQRIRELEAELEGEGADS